MYAPEYIVTSYGQVIPRVVIDVPAKRHVRLPRSPWHMITEAEVVGTPPAHMCAK
jgi:hypothetical protein